MSAEHAPGTTGKRVVVARDADGKLIVIGPVYSDKAAEETLAPMAAKAGLTVEGITRIYSKAEFSNP